MVKKISSLLLAGVAVAAFVSPAAAQERMWENGQTYGKLFVGAVMPEDIDSSFGATSGSLQFDTGWTAGGVLGYRVNPWLVVEGEVSYLRANTDKFTTGGASFNVDGHYSAIMGFANLNIHPLCDDPSDFFDPYIGAGIGAAGSKAKVNSVGLIPVNIKESSTDLAAHGTAGVNMRLAPGTKLGAQYRYIWTDTGNNTTDAFKSHAVTANLTFDF